MNLRDNIYIFTLNKLSNLSDDTEKGVAAIIVKNDNIISYGVNKLPKGCLKLEERCEAPLKYDWLEHAEKDAIFKAAKDGVKLKNSKMYVNYFPCCDCARAIISSGIKKIYAPKPDFTNQKWGESWKISLTMFSESDVNVVFID